MVCYWFCNRYTSPRKIEQRNVCGKGGSLILYRDCASAPTSTNDPNLPAAEICNVEARVVEVQVPDCGATTYIVLCDSKRALRDGVVREGSVMAIRKIARMGNPVLNWVAAKVADPGDPEIARLAGDMKDTLVDIGASASPRRRCSKAFVSSSTG